MVLLEAVPARADIALPLVVVSFPAMLAMLVPVILIEAWVYRRNLGLSFKDALTGSGISNAITTVTGFPIAQCLFTAVSLFWQEMGWDSASFPILRGMGGLFTNAGFIFEEPVAAQFVIGKLISLVPALWLSVIIERWVLRRLWKSQDPGALSKAVWRANLASYALLAVLVMLLPLASKLAWWWRYHQWPASY